MQNYFHILKDVELFKNVNEKEFASILSCIQAKIKHAEKGEAILRAGDNITRIGILLEGKLLISKEDYNGERMIINVLKSGELFGEALCCVGETVSPITVTADTNSIIMLIKFGRIMQTCQNACPFHRQFIENMLGIIAHKNIMLQKRMECIGKKTMRDKILCYLQPFSDGRGNYFSIPFNREQMADFLCVDRSALSHELSRMKKAGLIDYEKNVFKIH